MNLSTHNITERFKNKVKKEKAMKRKKIIRNLTGSASVLGVVILLTAFIITKSGIGIRDANGIGSGSDSFVLGKDETVLDMDSKGIMLDCREWYYDEEAYTIRWEGEKAYWYSILQKKDLAVLWEKNALSNKNLSNTTLKERETNAQTLIEKYKQQLKMEENLSNAVSAAADLKTSTKGDESGLWQESYVETSGNASNSVSSEEERIKGYLRDALGNEIEIYENTIKELISQMDSTMKSKIEQSTDSNAKYSYLPNDAVDLINNRQLIMGKSGTLYFAVGKDDGTAEFYAMDINGENKVIIMALDHILSDSEVYEYLQKLVE